MAEAYHRLPALTLEDVSEDRAYPCTDTDPDGCAERW
jgi:hypothetical protein